MESGYYPEGLEDNPRAPWNERELPAEEFDVVISATLSKSLKISTTDYESKVSNDEDGDTDYADTSGTNWHMAYINDGHLTPRDLINLLRKKLEVELEEINNYLNGRNGIALDDEYLLKTFEEAFHTKRYITHIIEECKDWIEDEIEVVED